MDVPEAMRVQALYAALSGEARRREFHEALGPLLRDRGIEGGRAVLGRLGDGRPAWLVTTSGPGGLQRFRVAFPAGTDPFAWDALRELVERVDRAYSQASSA